MKSIKELLKEYLLKTNKLDFVEIYYYNIDGANCEVAYYTSKERFSKKKENINIWHMVIYLNKNK